MPQGLAYEAMDEPDTSYVPEPVAVRLLPGGRQIEVSVDSAWLRDPGTRYPVVIDPTILPGYGPNNPSDDGTSADAFVGTNYPYGWNGGAQYYCDGAAVCRYYNVAGYNSDGNEYYSYLWYDVRAIAPADTIYWAAWNGSFWNARRWGNQGGGPFTLHPVTGGTAGGGPENASWNHGTVSWWNKPGHLVGQGNDALGTPASAGSSVRIDVSSWVRRWQQGTPNSGLVMNTDGRTADAFWFYADEGGGSETYLEVSYSVYEPPPPPPPPANGPPSVSPVSPADGAALHTLTPTLAVTSGDPDGDPLLHDFWVTTNPDPYGPLVWEPVDLVAGTSVTVPWEAGLQFGQTYYWHALATDGEDATFCCTRSFTLTNTPPPTPTPTTPADGAVVLPGVMSLAVNPVADADGDSVWYRYLLSSDGTAGAHVDSGWLSGTTSWPVPTGLIQDGVRYTWQVQTHDGYTSSALSAARTFTVDQRLGDRAALPYDTVGPVRVNLFNGNLVVQTGSPSFPTVGGAVGLAYTYNSQAAPLRGLTGAYFATCDSASATWQAGAPVLVPNDTEVNFDWGDGTPGPMVGSENFCARWTGYLTVPASGAYTFGAASAAGARVQVGPDVVLDRWTSGATWPTPNYAATATQLAAGTQVPVTIEFHARTGIAGVKLFVQGPGLASAGERLDPNWLTPDAPALPRGWAVSADLDGALAYTRARVSEASVTVFDASGAGHVFTATPDRTGWTPPAGSTDVLARDATGLLTVHRDDGSTYSFNADGTLDRSTWATDDRLPAAAQYTWDGTPVRLTAITDPVSARTIRLRYGGDADCPTSPPPGFATAPAGMLCSVAYWDGTASQLWYQSGLLARLSDPGGEVTDFAYTGSRLSAIRDPLAADAVTTGNAPNDDSTQTLIAYDAAGRVASVTLPKALVGESVRSTHSYEYVSPTRTRVHVAGLAEPNGYAREVDMDATGRLLADRDATGRATSAVWDVADRVTSTTDAAGRRTTTLYDPSHRPTEVYGPAPSSCFSGQVPNGTCASPPVPHATTAYDEGILGLAATYWPTRLLQPAPKLHDTGVPTDPSGALNADWGTTACPMRCSRSASGRPATPGRSCSPRPAPTGSAST